MYLNLNTQYATSSATTKTTESSQCTVTIEPQLRSLLGRILRD